MPYVRHTLITFDNSEKRDAFVSRLTTVLDGLQDISTLRAMRLAFDTAEDPDTVRRIPGHRLMASAIYNDKQSMDAADERINEALPDLMPFISGEPVVREGEIIWAFDNDGGTDKPAMPGYIRHTTLSIDPSKLDGLIAYADSTVSTLKSISGLRRIRVAAVKGTPPYKSEDRMVVTAGYNTKEAAGASTEQTASIWSGMTEFLADDSERTVLAGDLIYAYNR